MIFSPEAGIENCFDPISTPGHSKSLQVWLSHTFINNVPIPMLFINNVPSYLCYVVVSWISFS